jgi:ABC-2 type transport system ATP-binding protein
MVEAVPSKDAARSGPTSRRELCRVRNSPSTYRTTKSFVGRKVVDNFSIQVPRGQVWGFLGPNGSGKTTTIRLLCGLLVPDSGRGTCLGFDIRRESAAIKRNVGYMTQRFSFYEDLSIRENLDFVARVYAMPDRKAAVSRH